MIICHTISGDADKNEVVLYILQAIQDEVYTGEEYQDDRGNGSMRVCLKSK